MNRLFPLAMVVTVSLQTAISGDPEPKAGPEAGNQISGWGTVFNPAGDCAITAIPGGLSIKVPGGIHDFSGMHNVQSAPRVLRPVEGDFEFEVKVTGSFEPGPRSPGSNTHPFNSAGIMVWGANTNYLRFERDIWVDDEGVRWCYAPLFEYWYRNRNLKPKGGTSAPYFQGTNTWLRLTRKAEEFAGAISHDGKEWQSVETAFTRLPRSVMVGVMAINTSAAVHQVDFTELKFKQTAGQKSE